MSKFVETAILEYLPLLEAVATGTPDAKREMPARKSFSRKERFAIKEAAASLGLTNSQFLKRAKRHNLKGKLSVDEITRAVKGANPVQRKALDGLLDAFKSSATENTAKKGGAE